MRKGKIMHYNPAIEKFYRILKEMLKDATPWIKEALIFEQAISEFSAVNRSGAFSRVVQFYTYFIVIA